MRLLLFILSIMILLLIFLCRYKKYFYLICLYCIKNVNIYLREYNILNLIELIHALFSVAYKEKEQHHLLCSVGFSYNFYCDSYCDCN